MQYNERGWLCDEHAVSPPGPPASRDGPVLLPPTSMLKFPSRSRTGLMILLWTPKGNPVGPKRAAGKRGGGACRRSGDHCYKGEGLSRLKIGTHCLLVIES